jgi:acyl carrier protein
LPAPAAGKLDHRTLAAPEESDAQASHPPRTETEQILCEQIALTLGFDEVGLDENFFALGGNSLLAVELLAKIRRALGVKLSLRALIRSPTAAGLSAALAQSVAPPLD